MAARSGGKCPLQTMKSKLVILQDERMLFADVLPRIRQDDYPVEVCVVSVLTGSRKNRSEGFPLLLPLMLTRLVGAFRMSTRPRTLTQYGMSRIDSLGVRCLRRRSCLSPLMIFA